MSRGRSRARRRATFAIALATAAALTVSVASCVAGEDEQSTPQSVVDTFVGALSDHDVDTAAEQTSYPAAAREVIGQMFDGLDPKEADFDVQQLMELGPESGFFTMNARWNFGEGRDWEYPVQASLRKLSVGWRISWEPQIMGTAVENGRTVRYTRTDAAAPRVLDAGGGVLANEQTINTVRLDPSQMPDAADTTRRLAQVLEPVAPLITSESMLADLAEKPGESVVAVRLRDQDYEYMGPEKFAIPGVVVDRTPTLITADRRISTPLLDPLRNVWQANRDASAGWAVLSEGEGGPQIAAGFQGPPGPDVPATLDPRIQLAATEAAVIAGTPTVVVAMQPSTGAVLATAQNNQAYEQGPIAFTGLYPAGSGLDVVRDAAARQAGVSPADLSSEQFEETARSLGLGIDFEVQGLEQQTAVLTSAQSKMDQAMGSRDVPAVTPLGMAVLASSIARGAPALPKIVQDQPPITDADLTSLPPEILDGIRGRMRADVATGPANLLARYPDLIGTAGSHDDDRWFYGSRGDLAFAVFVGDADSGDRAMQVANRFLQELDAPPA